METITQKTECRGCGALKREGVEWFDDDYCSGKCRRNDGAEMPIRDVQAHDTFSSETSVSKHAEIVRLENHLIRQRKQLEETSEEMEQLQRARGDLLAKGLDTAETSRQYDKAEVEHKRLTADILMIESETIPAKRREFDSVKKVESDERKQQALDRKPEFVEQIQKAFDSINEAIIGWNHAREGASLNPKSRDLFNKVIISDATREGLKPRIKGKRIAQLSGPTNS